VIAALGAFKKPKINPFSTPTRRLAAVIAARNEEPVIGQLVESLMDQRYPRELFDVFVIVNNCTDDTRGAAERAGAKVIECTFRTKTKGDALNFAFDALVSSDYDAFVIFDADNVVHPGFFQAVNNARAAGAVAAQGFRDSKNADDNWIAGGTATFYWGMCRLYNRARNNLGMSCALNGTGLMVSVQLLRDIGWGFHTLCEDLEFSAQCALNGTKIGWMEDAITYDEQPVKFIDSFVQRRRWSAGTFQCFKRYGRRLFSRMISHKSSHCMDMLIVFTGTIVQLLCFIPPLLVTASYAMLAVKGMPAWMGYLRFVAMSTAGMIIVPMTISLVIGIAVQKMNKKRLSAVLLFPLYVATWMVANVLCMFTRAPKWKHIRHGSTANPLKDGVIS
jgi:cellulose synthase/poly-beta-1,6-N-acetylglucosamine synthase-like glycosyltransferase